MIHLCVVNHCEETATFYLSEPNPDHMAPPSLAHSSASPPFSSQLSSFPASPSGVNTSSSSISSPSSPSLTVHLFTSTCLHILLRRCLLLSADFWESLSAVCVCVCVCVCVRVCVLGRQGQASLAVSYNQRSRVPVMLCIVRTHHQRNI